MLALWDNTTPKCTWTQLVHLVLNPRKWPYIRCWKKNPSEVQCQAPTYYLPQSCGTSTVQHHVVEKMLSQTPPYPNLPTSLRKGETGEVWLSPSYRRGKIICWIHYVFFSLHLCYREGGDRSRLMKISPLRVGLSEPGKVLGAAYLQG